MHIICRNVKVPLNFVRERIKHVYGTILLGIPVKKNHRLSSILNFKKYNYTAYFRGNAKYQLFTCHFQTFENICFLHFKQVKHTHELLNTYVVQLAIA